MTTFSQLVDAIVRETRRPDMLTDIGEYLNQTIREVHFTPERGAVIPYRENLQELQLVANSESGYGWDVPRPATFQFMQAVQFPSVHSRDGKAVYAVERVPSRMTEQSPYWYYRAGSRFVFSGYGGVNSYINLAFYEYPRRLAYFAEGARPAVWDDTTQDFTYHADWTATDELRLDARNLSSNWLLVRWRDVLAEGVRAKLYKRLSDENRQRTSYSLYSQLRQGLFTSEVSTGGSLT